MIKLINKKALMAMTLTLTLTSANAQIPYVYDVEDMGSKFAAPEKVAYSDLKPIENLPDPFLFHNGKRSTKFKDWEKHRSEISHMFQYYEIGQFPSAGKESCTATLEDGRLAVTVKHDGKELVLTAMIKYPDNATYPCPAILGISNCLPRDMFYNRGIATIDLNVFEVTAHTQKRGSEPINTLYPELVDNGSYCFWSWGVSRIIDGLQLLGPEKTKIDTRHLAISGCSWAGKASLYAGAFDERICLVIPQEPGGGGIAAWRVSETLDNVERSFNTNDAWFFANIKTDYAQEKINLMPVDHHELAALVCPRALLYFGNQDYEWLADPSGYVSIQAAKEVYRTFGIADRCGFAIHGGHMHCQLPQEEYQYLEAYIDRFLLGKDVDTDFNVAPKFVDVDYKKWIADWGKKK